jgi:hypothetical protein
MLGGGGAATCGGGGGEESKLGPPAHPASTSDTAEKAATQSEGRLWEPVMAVSSDTLHTLLTLTVRRKHCAPQV